MNEPAQNFNRRSIRLKEYDYSFSGAYFVTICTQHRVPFFGEIIQNKMMPNHSGEKIISVWEKLPYRFPGIEIDEFVLMPNHFHGIVLIFSKGDHKDRPYDQKQGSFSLPRIIQGFKSISTNEYIKGVKANGWKPFDKRLWQRNYFERVIRNEKELESIREYIQQNPLKWAFDAENPLGKPDPFFSRW